MTKEELAKVIREDYERKGVWAIKTTTLTIKLDLEILWIILEALEEPKWIPVSERLPEAEYGESDSVLVCFENETQGVLYFNGGNWCYPTGETYISVNHKNGWHNKVVAWMSLPPCYKPQESEDKE